MPEAVTAPLLDVYFQWGGTVITIDVFAEGGGVDDDHAVFFGHGIIANHKTLDGEGHHEKENVFELFHIN